MNPFKVNKTILIALFAFCLVAFAFFQYLQTLI